MQTSINEISLFRAEAPRDLKKFEGLKFSVFFWSNHDRKHRFEVAAE
jgi:hypothetical protein